MKTDTIPRYVAVPVDVLRDLVKEPYYSEEFSEACSAVEKILNEEVNKK